MRGAVDWLHANRELTTPLDVIIEQPTPGNNPKRAQKILQPWVDAGATWNIESMWNVSDTKNGQAKILRRIQKGPPNI